MRKGLERASMAARAGAVALLLLPGIAAAQTVTYQGRLRCERIPNWTPGPLNAAFTVRAEGGRLTYVRTVQDLSGAPTQVAEQGTGTVSGGRVELHGRASGRDWSYEATYEGVLRADIMELSGRQLWTGAPVGGKFNRMCQARLAAEG